LLVSADQEWVSPIRTAVADDIARKLAEDPECRALHEQHAKSRQIAWLFIRYRMDHDLTQAELANRAGTTVGQIARIENGRSKTSLDTLMKLAHALHLKLLIGFEENAGKKREKPEPVAVQMGHFRAWLLTPYLTPYPLESRHFSALFVSVPSGQDSRFHAQIADK